MAPIHAFENTDGYEAISTYGAAEGATKTLDRAIVA
jgi:hypothetical protein